MRSHMRSFHLLETGTFQFQEVERPHLRRRTTCLLKPPHRAPMASCRARHPALWPCSTLCNLHPALRISNTGGVTSKKPDRRGCSVHNRLALLRTERGVSRADLATAVGVNPQTIGFIERGDYGPSLEVALRICAYFSLPIEAVFALTPLTAMSTQLYGTSTGDPQ